MISASVPWKYQMLSPITDNPRTVFIILNLLLVSFITKIPRKYCLHPENSYCYWMPHVILARWLRMWQQRRIAVRWTREEIQIRSVFSEDWLKYMVVTVQIKEPAYSDHTVTQAENLSCGNSSLLFIFHHPASYLKNGDYKVSSIVQPPSLTSI